MHLLTLSESQHFLQEEFAELEPAIRQAFLLRDRPLPVTEIQQAEALLQVKFPVNFAALLEKYDFGNFTTMNIQFGSASTGSLAWLLTRNDSSVFGNNTIQELQKSALLILAVGDPFLILLNSVSGTVAALAPGQRVDQPLVIASSFEQFIVGIITAFKAMRQGRLDEFYNLAHDEFGEETLPFWQEIVF